MEGAAGGESMRGLDRGARGKGLGVIRAGGPRRSWSGFEARASKHLLNESGNFYSFWVSRMF